MPSESKNMQKVGGRSFKIIAQEHDATRTCPQEKVSNTRTHELRIDNVIYIYILGVASASLFDVSVRIPERFIKSPGLFLKT